MDIDVRTGRETWLSREEIRERLCLLKPEIYEKYIHAIKDCLGRIYRRRKDFLIISDDTRDLYLRDDGLDASIEVELFPFSSSNAQCRTLFITRVGSMSGIFKFARRMINKALESTPYGYFDNAPKPYRISQEVWNERELAWIVATGSSPLTGIARYHGFVFTLKEKGINPDDIKRAWGYLLRERRRKRK